MENIRLVRTNFVSMQMSFSTADQERMVFHTTIGTPQADPTVHPTSQPPSLLEAPPVEEEQAPIAPAPVETTWFALVSGSVADLDGGSPPGAVPLDEAAGILRLPSA